MEWIARYFTTGLNSPNDVVTIIIQFVAAIVFGFIIGYDREKAGKAAGIRTYVLVTLGTTVFLITAKSSGLSSDALARVIEGIITGIGFVGAGAILKLNREKDVKGLTTSAGIWMAAAIGVAIGLRAFGIALFATVSTYLILRVLGMVKDEVEPIDTEND